MDSDDEKQPTKKTAKKTASTKPRYNENEVMQTFLNSKSGILFLIEKAKQYRLSTSTSEEKKRLSFANIVDEVIDFYVTWAFKSPIRRNDKISQYDLLKIIENHCEKVEVKRFFEYLFDE